MTPVEAPRGQSCWPQLSVTGSPTPVQLQHVQQRGSRSPGRSLAALAVTGWHVAAHVPALLCGLGRLGSTCLSWPGQQHLLPPSLPPSHGITRFLGADSEFGKAATPTRQGGGAKLLLKVCLLNVFKCHICFVWMEFNISKLAVVAPQGVRL